MSVSLLQNDNENKLEAFEQLNGNREYEPPQGAMEEKLAVIWCKIHSATWKIST